MSSIIDVYPDQSNCIDTTCDSTKHRSGSVSGQTENDSHLLVRVVSWGNGSVGAMLYETVMEMNNDTMML